MLGPFNTNTVQIRHHTLFYILWHFCHIWKILEIKLFSESATMADQITEVAQFSRALILSYYAPSETRRWTRSELTHKDVNGVAFRRIKGHSSLHSVQAGVPALVWRVHIKERQFCPSSRSPSPLGYQRCPSTTLKKMEVKNSVVVGRSCAGEMYCFSSRVGRISRKQGKGRSL